MAHFSKQEIDEIARRLSQQAVKDTELASSDHVNMTDIVAIVQDGVNKKVPLSVLFDGTGFDESSRYMRIAQSRGGLLLYGEDEIVTVTIIDGFGRDKTDEYYRFSLRRESGDEASDNVWNAGHTDVGHEFVIGTNDLNINYTTRTSNLFRVTAVSESGPVNGEILYSI